jgi:dephospho-CoA kinase
MLLVGLTGNIASGKSEVSRLLAERGAHVLDADDLAREVVAAGTPAQRKIAERWGTEVVGADGAIDRARLRKLVFGDTQELEELNEIVHPEIDRLRDDRISAAREQGVKILIYVAPLLFERHLADEFDKIILVDAPRDIRFDRLVRIRGLAETEALNMIAAQMPAALKRARADYILENTGSLTELRRSVDNVWRSLERDAEREAVEVS